MVCANLGQAAPVAKALGCQARSGGDGKPAGANVRSAAMLDPGVADPAHGYGAGANRGLLDRPQFEASAGPQNRCVCTPPCVAMTSSRSCRLTAAFRRWGWGCLVAASTLVAQAQNADHSLPGEYRVVDGRIDAGTYNGWRLFEAHCRACHGAGATGTAKAPDLVQRISNYTPRGFASKVLTSYRIVRMSPENGAKDQDAQREALLEEVMRRERTARGQPVMPAWDGDEAVPPHVLDLYAYLSARADGAIGPGKPPVMAPAKKR
jgi:mono/diheme cytochrome c family protein